MKKIEVLVILDNGEIHSKKFATLQFAHKAFEFASRFTTAALFVNGKRLRCTGMIK